MRRCPLLVLVTAIMMWLACWTFLSVLILRRTSAYEELSAFTIIASGLLRPCAGFRGSFSFEQLRSSPIRHPKRRLCCLALWTVQPLCFLSLILVTGCNSFTSTSPIAFFFHRRDASHYFLKLFVLSVKAPLYIVDTNRYWARSLGWRT